MWREDIELSTPPPSPQSPSIEGGLSRTTIRKTLPKNVRLTADGRARSGSRWSDDDDSSSDDSSSDDESTSDDSSSDDDDETPVRFSRTSARGARSSSTPPSRTRSISWADSSYRPWETASSRSSQSSLSTTPSRARAQQQKKAEEAREERFKRSIEISKKRAKASSEIDKVLGASVYVDSSQLAASKAIAKKRASKKGITAEDIQGRRQQEDEAHAAKMKKMQDAYLKEEAERKKQYVAEQALVDEMRREREKARAETLKKYGSTAEIPLEQRKALEQERVEDYAADFLKSKQLSYVQKLERESAGMADSEYEVSEAATKGAGAVSSVGSYLSDTSRAESQTLDRVMNFFEQQRMGELERQRQSNITLTKLAAKDQRLAAVANILGTSTSMFSNFAILGIMNPVDIASKQIQQGIKMYSISAAGLKIFMKGITQAAVYESKNYGLVDTIFEALAPRVKDVSSYWNPEAPDRALPLQIQDDVKSRGLRFLPEPRDLEGMCVVVDKAAYTPQGLKGGWWLGEDNEEETEEVLHGLSAGAVKLPGLNHRLAMNIYSTAHGIRMETLKEPQLFCYDLQTLYVWLLQRISERVKDAPFGTLLTMTAVEVLAFVNSRKGELMATPIPLPAANAKLTASPKRSIMPVPPNRDIMTFPEVEDIIRWKHARDTLDEIIRTSDYTQEDIDRLYEVSDQIIPEDDITFQDSKIRKFIEKWVPDIVLRGIKWTMSWMHRVVIVHGVMVVIRAFLCFIVRYMMTFIMMSATPGDVAKDKMWQDMHADCANMLCRQLLGSLTSTFSHWSSILTGVATVNKDGVVTEVKAAKIEDKEGASSWISWIINKLGSPALYLLEAIVGKEKMQTIDVLQTASGVVSRIGYFLMPSSTYSIRATKAAENTNQFVGKAVPVLVGAIAALWGARGGGDVSLLTRLTSMAANFSTATAAINPWTEAATIGFGKVLSKTGEITQGVGLIQDMAFMSSAAAESALSNTPFGALFGNNDYMTLKGISAIFTPRLLCQLFMDEMDPAREACDAYMSKLGMLIGGLNIAAIAIRSFADMLWFGKALMELSSIKDGNAKQAKFEELNNAWRASCNVDLSPREKANEELMVNSLQWKMEYKEGIAASGTGK